MIGVKNKQREIESNCSLCPKRGSNLSLLSLLIYLLQRLHLSLAASTASFHQLLVVLSSDYSLCFLSGMNVCSHADLRKWAFYSCEIMKPLYHHYHNFLTKSQIFLFSSRLQHIMMLFYLLSNITINFTELAMNTSCNLGCLLCFVWRRR